MKIHQMIPDAKTLLALEPEEFGGVLLEHWHSLPDNEKRQFHFTGIQGSDFLNAYPQESRYSIEVAYSEAWAWLEREGFIVPLPGDNYGWMIFSRRGQRLKTRQDVQAYRHGSLLPREQLHPTIALKVHATFLRGDYDTAVFQSFKEVEVAVRDAAKFASTDFGTALMRKAFDKATGPLADPSQPETEREAMAHLFAGSIGLYKNPHSHRNVPLTDPVEAVEMIVFASHLLRIVDGRRRQ